MGRNEGDLECRAIYDPADFINIYDYYLPRVYKYIRCRINNQDEAEDLTSKVFEQVLTNIGRYNPERAPFTTWIFTITHNILTDFFRMRERRQIVSIELLGELACARSGPADAVVQNETREELLRALSRLIERERNIIGLKFAAGLSNRAISEMIGLTESNVAVILYRALKKMKSDLSTEK